MEPVERLIFALDVPDCSKARDLVQRLQGHVGAIKIGLELFSEIGPLILTDPTIGKMPILLDLKLHDIPETIRRTTLKFKNAPILGITAHAAGGKKMLEAAVSTGVPIYAVTVLTSMDQSDLNNEGIGISPRDLVLSRAHVATAAGCTGLIASAAEVETIRMLHPYTKTITPGIRPAGKDKDDQKRVSTPRMAIKNGAGRIVVGRAIRDDNDPAAAADRIVEEIKQGLEDRA
mgnify:CR=1 FL=1